MEPATVMGLRRIDALLDLGRTGEALEHVTRALETDATDPDLLVLLARARFNLGQMQASREACEAAIAAAPHFTLARAFLAHILLHLEDIEGARMAADGALGLDPEHPSALEIKVMVELDAGDEQMADAVAQRMVALWPEIASAHHAAGQAASACKRWGEAEEAFRRALEIQPENPHILSSLGRLLVQRGQRREGVTLLQAAAEAEPENVARRRETQSAVPEVDESRLLLGLAAATGASLALLLGWTDNPELLIVTIGLYAFSAFEGFAWWRRRRLALPERTETFLDRAEAEEAHPKAFAFLLSVVLATYAGWLALLTAWLGPVPGEPPAHDPSLQTWLAGVSLVLILLVPWVRGWLQALPSVGTTSFLWWTAAITVGVPWVRLVFWLGDGLADPGSTPVRLILAMGGLGVLVTTTMAVRWNLELERQME